MRSLRTPGLLVAGLAATAAFWAYPGFAPADSAQSSTASASNAPAFTSAFPSRVRPISHLARPAAPRRVVAHTVAVVRPAAPAPPAAAPAPPPPVAAAPAVPAADTCGAALAYLAAHSAPGFQFECPGYALGHQAMTCMNVAGVCPGQKLIAIAVVCPASYMNEASNSWVVIGQSNAPIDPYGYCH